MNILYLAHRIPYPPDKGDKLRSYREVEHLARRHRVWCACFVDNAADEEYVNPLRAFCQEVAAIPLSRARARIRGLAGLLRGRTLTESFYSHSQMRAILKRWSRAVDFDAAVAFSSSMARYALAVRAKKHVLDLCDLDSQKWLDYAKTSRGFVRRLYETEGRWLAAAELTYLDKFDATLVITQAEAKPLLSAERCDKLHILRNGVSLPDLNGDGNGSIQGSTCDGTVRTASRTEQDGQTSTGPIVGFVGVMDYRPNVEAVCWFVSDCWPRVHRAFPEAILRVVGRSPTHQVRRLAAVPGIEVVGGVPDAMAEVLRFDVSVAPMRTARGLQNKVLEAMAAARPVVLTSRAAEGIDARDGNEFLITDEPGEFSENIVRLLHDPVERRRLGKNARRFVAVNHCWEESLRRLELIVTGALVRSARPRSVQRMRATEPTEDLATTTIV